MRILAENWNKMFYELIHKKEAYKKCVWGIGSRKGV